MLINHGKEGKTTRKSKLENNVKLKNAVQEKKNSEVLHVHMFFVVEKETSVEERKGKL